MTALPRRLPTGWKGALKALGASGRGGCLLPEPGKPSHPGEPQSRSRMQAPSGATPFPRELPACPGLVCRFQGSPPPPPPPPGWATSAPSQHFPPPTTARPHALLDHIGYFCPRPHSAVFEERESWDCGHPMGKAFTTPVVTEWNSVLEIKQPEITQELGLLQRLLEKTLPPMRRAAGHREESRASGSQSHG